MEDWKIEGYQILIIWNFDSLINNGPVAQLVRACA
jgi:hypothetical protein